MYRPIAAAVLVLVSACGAEKPTGEEAAAVQEAVLRYLLDSALVELERVPASYCLSLDSVPAEPSEDFMSHFSNRTPAPLPVSACMFGPESGEVRRRSDSLPSVILWASPPSVREHAVEVNAGFHQSPTSSADYTCIVTREGEAWSVESCRLRAIS